MSAPFVIRRVRDAFEHTFSAGRNRVRVPVGARVVRGPDGRLWVDHNAFPNGIDRHDAEYYGVPVSPDNIESEAM
jgi:hypothetical protein